MARGKDICRAGNVMVQMLDKFKQRHNPVFIVYIFDDEGGIKAAAELGLDEAMFVGRCMTNTVDSVMQHTAIEGWFNGDEKPSTEDSKE
jgi:hypothetical protein